jgi:AAA+ ATPase superfamily predicted ATPase
MTLAFVDREAERKALEAFARRGGLFVLYGRRRVGKTRLLREWLEGLGGLYSQAIEGPADMQLAQIYEDVRDGLSTEVRPKTWAELLEILRVERAPWVLCIDEFPYLVATDPSLPSILQRWLDHSMPDRCSLVLSGSSQHMMHGLFLDHAAPLYGRAVKLLHVRPMDYGAFCRVCRLEPGDMDSFLRFSLVGGIPKYWEFLERGQSPVDLAEALYFDFAPYMEAEPWRILRDEGVRGGNAVAILDAVGRGAERPSEIAARFGTAQTNLSRSFAQLLDASVLSRDIPFGESVRTTKRCLYRIVDPALRFWFRVYSPHRSRWRTFPLPAKRKLLRDHAATVFEDHCRALHPGAGRYWEGDVEIDLVAPDPAAEGGLLVAEVKWARLSDRDRERMRRELAERWSRTRLAPRHPGVRFEVFDTRVLG